MQIKCCTNCGGMDLVHISGNVYECESCGTPYLAEDETVVTGVKERLESASAHGLTRIDLEEIRAALKRGAKLEAVKLYSKAAGVGLAAARKAVDQL